MATLNIDPKNPCDAVEQLRAAYYKIIAGQASYIVTFRSGPSQVERSVTYHKADATALMEVIRDFEKQCDAAMGRKPKRHAVYAGGVRR